VNTQAEGKPYGSNKAPHDRETANLRAWEAAEARYGKVVHRCPEGDGGLTCGKAADDG
jgi:hypothetical protein